MVSFYILPHINSKHNIFFLILSNDSEIIATGTVSSLRLMVQYS